MRYQTISTLYPIPYTLLAIGVQSRRAGIQRSKGFSLIELLVVIGLMAILVAILLPALAAARRQARVTETTSELQAISSACEGYKTMFSAYPGPVKEPDVAQNDNTNKTLSGTQNMILGLMGAIQSSAGAPAVTISITPYTGSSYSLFANFKASGVTDLSNSRSINAFYIPRSGEYKVVPGSTNTNPTLMDHNPDALPILYYRRDVGKTGASGDGGQVPVLGLYGSATGAPLLRGCNVEYTNSTTLQATSGLVCDQSKSGLTYSVYNTTVTSTDWGNADWGLVASKWPGGSGANPCPGGFVLVAADPNRFYAYPNSIVLFGGE